MSTQNPFSAEAQAALEQAFAAMAQTALLSGDAQARKFKEFQDLREISLGLSRLEQQWQIGHMQEVVRGLERMVRAEALQQSDIGGRLKALLAGLRGGAAPEPAVDPTPEPVPAPQPPVSPPPPAAPPAAAAAQPPVDPTARDTDLAHLHPSFREQVEGLIADLKKAGVPMKIFEAWRSPERQAHLFAQGRTRDLHKGTVTNADAWHSYHQYGLAVDMVIDRPGHGMWETGTPAADGWWKAYHDLAEKRGLERLSFEMPHVQPAGLRSSQLLSGEAPGPGDEAWFGNFAAAVARWPRSPKPPLPDTERPATFEMARAAGQAVAGIDWPSLPRLPTFDWSSRFGGQEWRVDRRGIFLRSGPDAPQHTPGEPVTIETALEHYAEAIAAASRRFDVPPELILMTIATETGAMRKHAFTGPNTFRWEAHVKLTTTGDAAVDGKVKGDYSAGPMQILSNTAREVNARQALGYANETDLKWFTTRPASAPKNLGLYDGERNIMLGTGYIHQQRGDTGLNPVLVAAAYNAGSLRVSGTGPWRIRVHGDHLDRACSWFGDACAVLAVFGRH